jgi:hypothetical protein
VHPHELAQKILSAGNCPIPGAAAAELLSACTDDVVPNSLPNFSEFSGPSLAAVAKSSPKKAKLIAQHSSDKEVFAEILAASSLHELALPALLHNAAFCDEQQLVEVHRLAWETHLTSAVYRTVRTEVVGRVPLRHQLDYLCRDPHPSYPLHEVAYRIGRALATGEQWPLAYMPKLVSRCADRRSSTTPDMFVDKFAAAFAAADSSVVLGILRSVKTFLEPVLYDKVVCTVYRLAPLVDVGLLEEMLSRLDTAEAFAEYRAHLVAQRRTHVPAYPSELSRSGRPLTRPALQALALAYPAAIQEVVARGEYVADDVDFVLDVAASTGEPAVAVAMLQRRWVADQTTKLSVGQFAAVMRTLASVPEAERPDLNADVVRSVPKGAALADVLALVSMIPQAGDFLYQRFTSGSLSSMAYTPSREDASALFDAMPPAQRVSAVGKLLHLWAYYSHPVNASGLPDGLADAVLVGVDSIPVSMLVQISEGPKYFATTLAGTFGDAPEKWRCAVALAAKATVPLSKLLVAANRLCPDTD